MFIPKIKLMKQDTLRFNKPTQTGGSWVTAIHLIVSGTTWYVHNVDANTCLRMTSCCSSVCIRIDNCTWSYRLCCRKDVHIRPCLSCIRRCLAK